MVRVITQDTYDEVVKENMEEFDMSAEEAIKEAIAQFEAQVFSKFIYDKITNNLNNDYNKVNNNSLNIFRNFPCF